ncbi:biotin/lipoyl-containing protein [Clostridium magnum]|uniref:Biotin carboxyl carrier protein of acetyl-CoA carboxylase n=1 Tax=Clostridium magnum DSM 2767 TaxID=1121326 RepID=A0A161WGW7_9CLOT|nr:biotin/lipoyl-containing protein [Clostridium magnum]KZL90915.1 glutaconyl-CoA decarboxylase subunit gamma [Clostridium magnum DSM 2767]SHJ37554.1 Biotin-requiring enzyme [Clostridium magnum DSM 2767]
MKKYMIKLNGKVYEVEMEEVTGEASAAISANQAAAPAAREAAPTAVEKETPVAPTAPVAGAETVEAPMPGTIVSIAVKVGDQVKKGQVLLVLEAMKMENEIVASRDAKVVSVNVSKGDMVNPGDALVQIS